MLDSCTGYSLFLYLFFYCIINYYLYHFNYLLLAVLQCVKIETIYKSCNLLKYQFDLIIYDDSSLHIVHTTMPTNIHVHL